VIFVKFEELTEEQAGALEFDTSSRGGSGTYDPLIAAVKAGKRVKVLLEGKQQMKNLKWAISGAAKRAGLKLDIRVLADKTGVVADQVQEADEKLNRLLELERNLERILKEAGITTDEHGRKLTDIRQQVLEAVRRLKDSDKVNKALREENTRLQQQGG
jgi:hypothetical protein